MTFTIKRIKAEQISGEFIEFVYESAPLISKMHGEKFNWQAFDFVQYARESLVLACYKGDKPVGALFASLLTGIFDPSVKIFRQDLLYSSMPHSRVAYLLMQSFIEVGKLHANHIWTMRGEKTNIKARSLEKLGFKEVETHYRLET